VASGIVARLEGFYYARKSVERIQITADLKADMTPDITANGGPASMSVLMSVITSAVVSVVCCMGMPTTSDVPSQVAFPASVS